MTVYKNRSQKHFFSLAALAIFVFVSVFCLTLSSVAAIICHAHTDAMADLNVATHSDHWRSVTTGEPTKMMLGTLAFIVAGLAFIVVAVLSSVRSAREHPPLYLRTHPPDRQQSYIIEFFSRGILHPKIYPA